jgi:hypothetical protein
LHLGHNEFLTHLAIFNSAYLSLNVLCAPTLSGLPPTPAAIILMSTIIGAIARKKHTRSAPMTGAAIHCGQSIHCPITSATIPFFSENNIHCNMKKIKNRGGVLRQTMKNFAKYLPYLILRNMIRYIWFEVSAKGFFVIVYRICFGLVVNILKVSVIKYGLNYRETKRAI